MRILLAVDGSEISLRAVRSLICMGSHGYGVLQNAILGLIATRVLHLARVPVLPAK